MPDPATPTADVETPQGGAPDVPETPASPPAGGGASDKVEMTRSELDRQLAAARRQAESDTKQSQEVKDLRAKAKRLDELEDAQKTETQRLTDERDREKTRADQANTQRREAVIRAEFAMAAPGKSIPAERFKAALRLLDLSGVDVTDEGVVTGLEKALDALIQENPFLVAQDAGNGVHVPASPKAADGKALTEAERKDREAVAAHQARARF